MPLRLLKRTGALLGLGHPSDEQAAKPVARSAVKPSKTARPAHVAKASTPYRSVSVIGGAGCCQAAKDIKGRKIVSSAMPTLPLPGCDRAKCTCRFQHHEDRREDPRRLEDLGVAIDGWVATERRGARKRGRRNSDK
ncbi:MAG: hypothetical protein ACR2I8_08365 [Steroidobacteraceae bacterium]